MILEIAITALIPSLVAVGVFFALRRYGPRAASRSTALPLALGLGYLVGHLGVGGTPPWPPVTSTQSLFYLVVAALIAAVTLARVKALWLRSAVRLLLLAGILGLILRAMVRYQWQPLEAALWLVGLATFTWLLWSAHLRSLERGRSRAQPLAWCLSLSACGVALVLAHSALLAQLSFVLVAVVASVYAVTLREPESPRLSLAVPVLLTIQVSLLLSGTFYADLAAYQAIGLAVAPLGVILAELRPKSSDRTRLVLGLLGVALILVPLLGVAAVEYSTMAGDDYGYDEE